MRNSNRGVAHMGKPAAQSVALPRIVDLDALDEIRDTLIGALHSGPIQITAGAVERISTNAVFMLLSAAESARRSDQDFSISEPSTVLRASIEKLGLAPAFAPVFKG